MTNSSEVDNQERNVSGAQRTSPLKLDELPSEILLLIFDYCHAFDLVRLSAVCTRFYDIAQDEILWYKRSKKTLATNQVSKRFRSRCNPLLNARTKWQVTHNWEYGQYQANILLSQNTKLMPWIQMTGDVLWWGGGNHMSGYERGDPFNPIRSRFWHEYTESDIGRFIVRDDYLISGHRDGSIKFWLKDCRYRGNHYYCSIERAHSKDVDAVEEINNIVISGSVDGLVKAWTSPTSQENISNMPLATLQINNRVKSLAVDPTGRKLAIGSSGIAGPALNICDTLTFSHFEEIIHNWRHGAGIMDMVWDDPNTLLTCGYDTCIRKWDLRTGKCVSYWTDPTDATIYCISSDYNYTMVTGTQFNCKAVLWDQRKPQYVQLYFMNLRRMSSPIYSISFDSTHLYAATDQTVVEMKFSGEPKIRKNYREILKYEKFISIEK